MPTRRERAGWAAIALVVAGGLAFDVARRVVNVDREGCNPAEPLTLSGEAQQRTSFTTRCDGPYEVQITLRPLPDLERFEEAADALFGATDFRLRWSVVGITGDTISTGTGSSPSGRRHSTFGAVIVLGEFQAREGEAFTLMLDESGRPPTGDLDYAVQIAPSSWPVPPKQARALALMLLEGTLGLVLVAYAAFAFYRAL